MEIIKISNITKDYGNRRGVFDLSFSVKKGEVFGFLGPNGAGKTTTIRNLLGFIKADRGSCTINGMDCFKHSAQIQKNMGYLPGEIAFMDDMTGIQFIKFVAAMKEITDFSRAEELMKKFELNPCGKIKKMSKGMKQKIGLVCAFMHEPDILILDEPTSGLDPLMQNIFVELILDEKRKGTTILMSSHMFEEVEKTCDRVGIIKEGCLIAVEDIQNLRKNKIKSYIVSFDNEKMAEDFLKEKFEIQSVNKNQITVNIKGDIMPFIVALGKYKITGLDVSSQSLEELFMDFYGGENSKKNNSDIPVCAVNPAQNGGKND